MDSIILRTVARLVIPFIQILGVYIVVNGHLSPGGAFAGGAVIASAFILGTMSLGSDSVSGSSWGNMGRLLESAGGITFVTVGLLSIFMGARFLANASAGYPLGQAGALISGGMIPLIGLALGLKVAATLTSLFRGLAGGREDD